VLSKQGEKELNNLDSRAGKTYPLTGSAPPIGAGTDGQNNVVSISQFFHLETIHEATEPRVVLICFDVKGNSYRMARTCVSLHVPAYVARGSIYAPRRVEQNIFTVGVFRCSDEGSKLRNCSVFQVRPAPARYRDSTRVFTAKGTPHGK
jgi:hypothetical protein